MFSFSTFGELRDKRLYTFEIPTVKTITDIDQSLNIEWIRFLENLFPGFPVGTKNSSKPYMRGTLDGDAPKTCVTRLYSQYGFTRGRVKPKMMKLPKAKDIIHCN